MTPHECEFESEVLSAVIQSRWPDRVDAHLRDHAATCGICSDVAIVAGAIDSARDELRAAAVIPDSGRMWWVAQMRARREAVKTASRPIRAVELLAGACAVGFTGACFGATSEWFQSGLQWLKAGIPEIPLSGLLVDHWAFALSMAAILLLVPAAAWLAARRD
jgi:hypothetical protein